MNKLHFYTEKGDAEALYFFFTDIMN